MDAEGGWADLELAQRIARAGTLSGAARALHVDQTTASRRLAALERRLGVKLFDRVGGRLAPTPALDAALDRLQAMDEDAAVALAAMRRSEAEAQGLVRIASVGFVLAGIVAPALGPFQRAHPGVALALHADDQLARFDRREADIAVRLGASGDDCGAGAKDRRGALSPVPRRQRVWRRRSAADRALHRRARPSAGNAHARSLAARRARRVRADRLDVLTEAAVALGAELTLPEAMARRDPRFVFADDCVATRPIYRLVHSDRARAPSVAAATRWIDETVAAWAKELAPC